MSLTLVVEVPSSTPPDAAIWISGNLPELGSWSGGGARLQPAGEGRFGARLAVPRGARVEYKVSCGGPPSRPPRGPGAGPLARSSRNRSRSRLPAPAGIG